MPAAWLAAKKCFQMIKKYPYFYKDKDKKPGTKAGFFKSEFW